MSFIVDFNMDNWIKEVGKHGVGTEHRRNLGRDFQKRSCMKVWHPNPSFDSECESMPGVS